MNLVQKRYDKAVKHSWLSAILLILLLPTESYLSQYLTVRLLVVCMLIVILIISLVSVYVNGRELVIHRLINSNHDINTKVN